MKRKDEPEKTQVLWELLSHHAAQMIQEDYLTFNKMPIQNL